MNIHERLKFYLDEANIHINRLTDVLNSLEKLYPLEHNKFIKLTVEEKDKLDVLAFRFSKLQDLLGTKIFRTYLIALQYPVEGKSFLELLKELEKEKIVNIDLWSEFRGVKNSLSHDYPFEDDEKLDAINYLIKHVKYLIDITNNIREKFETIDKRD